ncbi:MAG: glycosyltransferase [Sphaerospermopsis sp. SIO1G2]|nr:glycosyltransferase [Sphaerospermopsis sp. SIO1G1]NET70384.1 glycosyltransferase [Sphaerospermopsis sp. SIO1G2]
MKILVSLPKKGIYLNEGESIDKIFTGDSSSSGTISATVRLASLLHDHGFTICLSSNQEVSCSQFTCLKHNDVEPQEFDWLIVHESHWDGMSLTFGNEFLHKTFLWLHLYSCFAMVYSFIQAGGNRVICASIDCANTFRAVPEWDKKIAVAYNSYNEIFSPDVAQIETTRKSLIFIGAIRPSKGFPELMKTWSYLAQNQVDLELKIAGSIRIHDKNASIGPLGIAEENFETNQIKPWLDSLPERYQPRFLGSLTPKQLQAEINQSWAAIVNPSWYATETFCISAVEAQACNKTVFSVARGGLKETIYRENFNSLATDPNPDTLGNLIIQGLSAEKNINENGLLAGEYVRNKFSNESIKKTWINLLEGKPNEPQIPKHWKTSKDIVCDLLRYSNTSKLYYFYRSPHDRKILGLQQRR